MIAKDKVLKLIQGIYELPRYADYMETREFAMGALARKWQILEAIRAMEDDDGRE